MQDSILEFRLLNCKLTSRTLGAQGTSVPTTSNISFPWTPPTNLGHEIGSVLQIGSFWIRLQITELPWARYLVDAIRGTQRVILHTKYMSCPKSQQNKKSQPYKMTCPTLRLYNLVSKIPVREHIGFFRTKFRWIQFGKADLFWDLFTFTWKNLVRRWISNTMSTNGLDPPTSLLSTLWDNCWINGGQSGVWHCSWCATRACFQPTFVLFNPGMTTLQAAGTRQWCWLRFPRRRDFVTGFAFCWWCPCMCKIVWGNRSCVGHAGRCLPKSWFCTERWEKQKKTAQSQHPAELPVELASSGGIGVQILERDRGQSGRAVWLFLNDQLSHGWQPRTWSGTPLPSCIHGSLRKHIGINWEDYVHCKSINLFWRYGYTSCLFGKWPSQNLQTSPSQDLASWTSNSANPGAPLWALLGASIGLLHGTTSSTSGTHACWNVLKCDEMCWPSWRQIMVRRCLEQHRQLANYIFNLLDNRWLKRALAWTAGRRTRIGRPTHTHMGCANINWLPMAKFWRMEGNSNANRFLADTYGFLYWIFDAEVMRV